MLVVDDEQRLRAVLVRILRQESMEADSAADAEHALPMALSGAYDLVILDLLLPDVDGLTLLTEIMQRRPEQAVLVLSCVSDPETKMAALGLGADDYLSKPFHVGELVARVHARLRIASRAGPATVEEGQVKLDILHHLADSGSGFVSLTGRECQLLWELLRQPGTVISKDELLARVWGSHPDCSTNVVDVYVARLRGLLGRDIITTVRGRGYCVPRS